MEITSNARLARLFGWLLRRHTFVSYSLYTAGVRQLAPSCVILLQMSHGKGRPRLLQLCVTPLTVCSCLKGV